MLLLFQYKENSEKSTNRLKCVKSEKINLTKIHILCYNHFVRVV